MTEEDRVPLLTDSLRKILTTAALLEILWTIYLGLQLPRRYVAHHWDLAWVGIDVAQVVMLLLSAWALWKHRAVLTFFASTAATLLVVDAWFDVTTAQRGDFFQSSLSALVVELPSAIVLYWVALRTINHIAINPNAADESVFEVPIVPDTGGPKL